MLFLLSLHRLAARSSRTATHTSSSTMFPLPLAFTGAATTTATTTSNRRFYFTNGDRLKKDDPYQTLGLQWGDGSTGSDIKQAFRERARLLHPDVNTTDSPRVAQEKFQQLTKAYDTLMKANGGSAAGDSADQMDREAWRFHVWRQGDRIALDRDDVAGVKRIRPAQPAASAQRWAAGQLGHPDGRGVVDGRRAEYIGAGGTKRASSVGRGQSKWVQPKALKPWNPEAENESNKRVSSSSTIGTAMASPSLKDKS
jgi:hypothetical protein